MNKHIIILLAVILFIAILTACSPVQQTVEVTRVIPQTVVVTQIVQQTVVIAQIVEVTSTPEPPTSTPEPSPTLSFQKWTSTEVAEAFQSASLEAENTRPMTKDDYGAAPMRAIEGTRFIVPSICPDCGGRIMSFSNQEDLEITKAYYEEIGKNSAILFSWVFVKDNILVQINGSLAEEKAKQYESALLTLGQ